MTLRRKLIAVKSSAISSVGWLPNRDKVTGRIAVRFKNGRVSYYPANVAKWQRMMSAESIGTFYNSELKRKQTNRAANCSREDARRKLPGSGGKVNQVKNNTPKATGRGRGSRAGTR